MYGCLVKQQVKMILEYKVELSRQKGKYFNWRTDLATSLEA